MFRYFILLPLLTIVSVVAFGYGQYIKLECPSPNQIQITPVQNQYSWKGPDVEGFSAGNSIPLNGDKVLGSVTGTRMAYYGQLDYYDLLCLYPTNKTTQKDNLPPYTGFVFYELDNVQKGDCKANDTGFICYIQY